MIRLGKRVVVVGAGAAGLSTAIGLAEAGYNVAVLERDSATDFKARLKRLNSIALEETTSSVLNVPPTKRATIGESERFRQQLRRCLFDVYSYYFLPEVALNENSAEFLSSGGRKRRAFEFRCPVSRVFERAHKLRTIRRRDTLIDPSRMIRLLHHQLRQAGGRTVFGAEAVECRRNGERIVRVLAQTRLGMQWFPCDVVINAAGSRIRKLADKFDSQPALYRSTETSATAVLRFPWSFSTDPTLMQFFGDSESSLLNNLRIIPLGRTRDASASTSNRISVHDPDQIPNDLRAEHRTLLRLMAIGFEMLDLPDPQEISWKVTATPTESGTSASLFKRADNEIVCMPGGLPSVLKLRDAVRNAVDEYFAVTARRMAA